MDILAFHKNISGLPTPAVSISPNNDICPNTVCYNIIYADHDKEADTNDLLFTLDMSQSSVSDLTLFGAKEEVCGDLVCSAGEACSSCSNDCGSCIGGG